MPTTEPPYVFSLVLSGVTEATDEIQQALLDAGLDDVLLRSQDGSVFLDFERSTLTFEQAIIQAIDEVMAGTEYSVEFVSVPLDSDDNQDGLREVRQILDRIQTVIASREGHAE